MLSPASTEIIRATLPVVGAAIGDITPIFYRRMFAAHPSLERDLFNRGNQAQGDQQRALAAAIAMYATLLVDDSVTDARATLARIAHKHASLGVTPPQYDIVHEHLFAAIVEVLGDAVTPEVAAAWNEVYWHMAHALIDIEAGLYDEAGLTAGDVWRTVRVLHKTPLTADTDAFVLQATDGSPLPAGKPGQYISVAVRLPDGARQIRQYSLTKSSEAGTLSVSVKAVAPLPGASTPAPAGEVSNFLHEHVSVGDELDISHPFGELELVEGDSPLVLASAGIGVTPMIGFLRHLHAAQPNREVTVLHADRSPAQHAHHDEVAELVEALPNATLHRFYEEPGHLEGVPQVRQGYATLDEITLAPGADVYLCGPMPFMSGMYRAALERGVTEDRVHYEVFGPSKDLAGV